MICDIARVCKRSYSGDDYPCSKRRDCLPTLLVVPADLEVPELVFSTTPFTYISYFSPTPCIKSAFTKYHLSDYFDAKKDSRIDENNASLRQTTYNGTSPAPWRQSLSEYHPNLATVTNRSTIQLSSPPSPTTSPSTHHSPESMENQTLASIIDHTFLSHDKPTSFRRTSSSNRRKRTVFSSEELIILETQYSHNKFLTGDIKAFLLAELSVPGHVVVMWYQNRRAKDRNAGIVI